MGNLIWVAVGAAVLVIAVRTLLDTLVPQCGDRRHGRTKSQRKKTTESGINGNSRSPPVAERYSLVSRKERVFFDALLQTVGEELHVFPKVRLEDVVYLKRNDPAAFTWRNKINRKHVDFLLCDRLDVKPVLVIELDGKSHQTAAQHARDEDKDTVLEAAGVSVFRVPERPSYNVEKIRNTILAELAADDR